MKINFLNSKTLKIFALIGFTTLFFSACNESSTNSESEDVEVNEELENDLNKAKQVFYSLPSPIETAMLIKKAGAKYNEDFLNKITNISKYTTNKSMALNLGVYSADLSFASLFDQDIIDRMDKNVNNRDSLMQIISETLMNSNSFLKENDRPETAAIILAGAWTEGLYIAIQIAKTSTSNKVMVDRIIDQRLSLNTLLSLLEDYKTGASAETIKDLTTKLNEIKAIYDQIQVTTSKLESTEDTKTNVTTISSKTKVSISPEVFDNLCKTVEKFRKEITN